MADENLTQPIPATEPAQTPAPAPIIDIPAPEVIPPVIETPVPEPTPVAIAEPVPAPMPEPIQTPTAEPIITPAPTPTQEEPIEMEIPEPVEPTTPVSSAPAPTQPAPAEPASAAATARQGQPEPQTVEKIVYKEDPGIIKRLLDKAKSKIQERKRKKLDKIMSLFSILPQVTNKDVQKSLRVIKRTATRYLDQLEKEGKITQVGKTGKSVIYTKKP